jgi:hypothetical protein
MTTAAEQQSQSVQKRHRDEESVPESSELSSRLEALEEEARTIIRDQPVASVLAALGVGYLVARLASRSTR